MYPVDSESGLEQMLSPNKLLNFTPVSDAVRDRPLVVRFSELVSRFFFINQVDVCGYRRVVHIRLCALHRLVKGKRQKDKSD